MGAYIYNFPLFPACIIVSLLYAAGSLFFDRKNIYFAFTALVTALLASPLLIRLLLLPDPVWVDGIRYIAYCVTLAIFAAVIFALCNLSKHTRWLKYPALIILLLPSALYWSYFAASHAFLNVDAIIAIWQTNFKEAFEYLIEYVTLWQIFATLCAMFLLALAFHALGGLSLACLPNRKKIAAWMVVFLVCNSLACRATSANSLTLVFTNAGQDIAQYSAFRKSQQRRDDMFKKMSLTLSSNVPKKGVYVLVIGESHARDYTHAYGYPRKNSPWLDKMAQSRNFLLFTNAYACHTQTVPTLSLALTAKNQYNGIKLENAVSIIEAARAAGYETVWLSNQMKYGAWDTPVSVIASAARQQRWLNSSSGGSTFTASYDGALVDALDRIKVKDKMLIVIHLMGSHINYEMRYPRAFDKFGTKTDEDSYSNSLLYNDFVMKNIYERVRRLPNFKTLLYVSDHASIPKDKIDHDSAHFTPSMTHIPMYLCWSDAYARECGTKISALKKHKNSCFTNDLLFNLQMSLMGIKLPKIYEAQNDFAGARYNCDKRRFRTSGGKRKIAE